MRIWISLLLFATILLGGCASDVANRYYSAKRYPERSAETVELLFAKPSRKFEVIADFQSRGESPESLRKKAAKIGADAVIVTTLGGHYALNEQWASDDKHKGSYSRIIGSAIVYLE